MKKLCCLIFILTLNVQSYAQKPIEIKTNPFTLLIPESAIFLISAETILSESWGAELDLVVGEFNLAYVSGKHYFNPKVGGDGFFLGAFAGGILSDETSIGAGFFLGKKWLSSKNVLLDIGIGLGRGSDGLLPYAKLHVGYRFRSKQGG